jgi:hypothetical protein
VTGRGPLSETSETAGNDANKAWQAARRLRGFALHLMGYFAAMIVLVAVNLLTNPDNPWFMLPMVGWGAVLAVHAAYAMGLFRVFLR